MHWTRLLAVLLLILLPLAGAQAIDVAPGPGASIGSSGSLGVGGASSTSIVSSNGGITGFGNTWFTGGPIVNTPTAGLGCVFLNDLDLVCAGQQAGSAVNIRVYHSNNGGVTLPLQFTTGSTPGNLNATGQMVKSATGQYWLGLSANGGVGNNPLVSPDLNIWTATSGINIAPFAPTGTDRIVAGGPAGNTILTLTNSSTARICRAVAPSTAFVCTAPAGLTIAATGPSALAYVTGTTWLLIDGTAASRVFRSIDDGLTFTQITTLAGARGALGTADLVCTSATICIAHNGDTIFRSIDAGLTWSAPIAQGNNNLQGIINFGSGNLMILGSFLDTVATTPGCLPRCIPTTILGNSIRTVDHGLTWIPANPPWMTIAGTGGPIETLVARPNGTGVVIHSSNNNGPTNVGRNYGYTTSTPAGLSILNYGEIPVAGPVQAGNHFNSQTTGAATTAVPITITGVAGFHVHVYSVEARCGTAAATATVTLTDAATTVWTNAFTQVALVTQNSFAKTWTPGYTAGDAASVVITLGACSAGAGTLIIQADQF